MEEPIQEPMEEPITEAPIRLSHLPNTRRRLRDEEEQLGCELPLERNPPN